MNEDTQAYGAHGEGTASSEFAPPPRSPGSTHSPGRAALCALVPGLGAVYNRQYQKAVVHFAVFAALARMGDANGIFVMATLAFYLFMMIDAYRSAEVIRLQGPEAVLQEANSDEMQHLPLWGGFLILIGAAFLLDNMDLIRLRDVLDFWPLLFIAIGSYLLYGAYAGDGAAAGRRLVSKKPSTGSLFVEEPQAGEQPAAGTEER